MHNLLSPPSFDDLLRLLKAWRLWVLSALVGALLGTALYAIAPPPYRAQATVVVDFNLEDAWPQEPDRRLFYYLERETRKLAEVAWADETLSEVAARVGGVSVSELRDGKLHLAQPQEGGWHFLADDADPARAQQLAATWAQVFTERTQEGVLVALELKKLQEGGTCASDAADLESRSLGISPYIQVHASQTADLPVGRRVAMGEYALVGAVTVAALAALGVLFVKREET
ncbi:MAG: hypothetical protein D6770_10650 [Anaerolineae bacterium]|nr:MAG: hypothetical protein D6770_10650 [Anaerolineae bacterium]